MFNFLDKLLMKKKFNNLISDDFFKENENKDVLFEYCFLNLNNNEPFLNVISKIEKADLSQYIKNNPGKFNTIGNSLIKSGQVDVLKQLIMLSNDDLKIDNSIPLKDNFIYYLLTTNNDDKEFIRDYIKITLEQQHELLNIALSDFDVVQFQKLMRYINTACYTREQNNDISNRVFSAWNNLNLDEIKEHKKEIHEIFNILITDYNNKESYYSLYTNSYEKMPSFNQSSYKILLPNEMSLAVWDILIDVLIEKNKIHEFNSIKRDGIDRKISNNLNTEIELLDNSGKESLFDVFSGLFMKNDIEKIVNSIADIEERREKIKDYINNFQQINPHFLRRNANDNIYKNPSCSMIALCPEDDILKVTTLKASGFNFGVYTGNTDLAKKSITFFTGKEIPVKCCSLDIFLLSYISRSEDFKEMEKYLRPNDKNTDIPCVLMIKDNTIHFFNENNQDDNKYECFFDNVMSRSIFKNRNKLIEFINIEKLLDGKNSDIYKVVENWDSVKNSSTNKMLESSFFENIDNQIVEYKIKHEKTLIEKELNTTDVKFKITKRL